MGTLNPDAIDALNMLLEDVRASVEIEVALSNGATEYLERDTLTAMGVEDTLISCLLREWLDTLDAPVTRRINGIVLQALDLTRYDDRLLLFIQHQIASREQAGQLLEESGLNSEGRAILRSIVDAHTRHAAWSEQRAREFAETRDLEHHRPIERQHMPDPDRVESVVLPDMPVTRGTPRAVDEADGDYEDDEDGDNEDDEEGNEDGGMVDAVGDLERSSDE